MVCQRWVPLKGNSGQKKCSSNERVWKCKNEPSLTSMSQMVFEISHFNVRNLNKMDRLPFCRFLASFSLKYDITDILQDIEKWKCNISGVFCLICMKFCRLLEVNEGVLFDFKFCCYGNSNKNNKPLFKNKRLLFSINKKSVSGTNFSSKLDTTCSSNQTALF